MSISPAAVDLVAHEGRALLTRLDQLRPLALLEPMVAEPGLFPNAQSAEAAKALLANPDIGVTQIAHRLGVSPATLYRYIPAARTANRIVSANNAGY
jgi:hypothetical protein